MANGLYNADGSFIDFAEQSEMLDEFATRASHGDFYSWLGTLPDPDPVLRKMSNGDEILDELLADDQVITATQGRKLGTLGLEYGFTAGALKDTEPTQMAESVFQMLSEDLENIDIYNLIAQILDAPFYGMVPMELMWQIRNGQYRLTDVRPRPTHWFQYDDKNQPRFMTLDSGIDGKPLPPYKFVFARHFPTYKNPYGLRLLSRCFWPVTFKRGGRKFWAVFCEKFGMPWVVGKYAKGTSPADKHEMLTNLQAMVQDAVAVIPQSGSVDLVTVGTNNAEVHKGLVDHMDAAISKVLQGQTLTSDVSQDGAAYSAGKVHAGTLEAYQAADRKLVKAAMEEIAWVYTKLNMPQGVISPSFVWPIDEDEKQDDKSARDTELTKQGLQLSKNYYMKTYNLDVTDIVSVGTTQNKPPLNFADVKSGNKYTPEQQAVEDLVAEAVKQVSLANVEKQIKEAVAQSKDFDELTDRLAALLSGLDVDGLQSVLDRAAIVAAGFGTTLDK